jgi:dGTPase
MDVLRQCEGADPRIVHEIYKELKANQSSEADRQESIPRSIEHFRSLSSFSSWRLPAADPSKAQWWFTLDTVDWLTETVVSVLEGLEEQHLLFLGAPTPAYRMASMGYSCTVLDVDKDVLEVLGKDIPNFKPEVYDAAQQLPEQHKEKYTAVIMDPPWYEQDMKLFLKRSIEALKIGGYGYCSLLPQLVRSSAEEDRAKFIRYLMDAELEILALERGRLEYIVPRFEEAAFSNLKEFTGKPWRTGDLIQFRKVKASSLEAGNIPEGTTQVNTYARRKEEFRVFFAGTASASSRLIINEIQQYSSNVSRQPHKEIRIDLWTSEKKGVQVEKVEEALAILEVWSKGGSIGDAISTVQKATKDLNLAETIVRRYDEVLELWTRFAEGSPRRTEEEIDKKRQEALSEWATSPSDREYSKTRQDGFRLAFQRDRDRILWSSGLRKLANKTQLFPVEHDDQLRQRLAHSIEVMQLASTIAASFGLDRDLIEAGALAHDIGHTPFGHAGEYALDKLIRQLDRNLPGFNHYEHGVDVVRWLEDAYQSPAVGGHPGLDLTPEVCECIFKHTYCHIGDPLSHSEIRRKSKHRAFLQDGYCHLEGQAVRIADKVSYLISDLEDGIHLGAITSDHLLRCRLFYRPPIDMKQSEGESLYRRFISQRRNIIKVLMEDIIIETGKRLARFNSLKQQIRNSDCYAVDHSDDLKADVDEVWRLLQVNRLHKDPRVINANMRAARIVSQLALLFTIFPEFIDADFRTGHERLHSKQYMRYYRECGAPAKLKIQPELLGFLPLELLISDQNLSPGTSVDVPLEHLIQAKDFVAGLTDRQATMLNEKFIGTSYGLR